MAARLDDPDRHRHRRHRCDLADFREGTRVPHACSGDGVVRHRDARRVRSGRHSCRAPRRVGRLVASAVVDIRDRGNRSRRRLAGAHTARSSGRGRPSREVAAALAGTRCLAAGACLRAPGVPVLRDRRVAGAGHDRERPLHDRGGHDRRCVADRRHPWNAARLVAWRQASITANRSGTDVRRNADRNRGIRMAARLRAAVVRDRRTSAWPRSSRW